MTDTLARMKSLRGTTAEWAADDIVIGLGEIAVELTAAGGAKLKVGDGTRTFSALPYVAGGTTGSFLPTAGGTLTGGVTYSDTALNSSVIWNMANGPSGDYMQHRTQPGGNVGFWWVARNAADEEKILQWTRNGTLVLRHTDPAHPNDYMGITVEQALGSSVLKFEHTDSDGNETGTGWYYFACDSTVGAEKYIAITPSGNITTSVDQLTDTPTAQELTTKAYVDNAVTTATGGGLTQGVADGRYLRLTGGTVNGVLNVSKPAVNANLAINVDNGAAGDYINFNANPGGTQGTGFWFTARDNAGTALTMHWTRQGVLTLKNKDGSNDYYGIDVSSQTIYGAPINMLTFEHTDDEGTPTGTGAYLFKCNPNGTNYASIGTDGNITTSAANPTDPKHLTTKQYVDTAITAGMPTGGISQAQGDARYLQLTGGALTGDVTRAADPATANSLSRKSYVDAQVAGRLTQAAADARYLNATSADTASGRITFNAGWTAASNSDITGYSSILRLQMLNASPAGNYAYIGVPSGNAGIHFVSREGGSNTRTMQWTRSGALVLKHPDTSDNNYFALQVQSFGTARGLAFERSDADGNSQNNGFFVFRCNSTGSVAVTIGTDGNTQTTATPTANNHYITMGFADGRYTRGGITQATADGRYQAKGNYLSTASPVVASGALDMNSGRILNLGSAVTDTQATNRGDVKALIKDVTDKLRAAGVAGF